MKTFLAIVLLSLFFIALPIAGQTFSSGSTGVDGALDLSTMSCTTCEVQLPPNGVLNYTTVNVPAGKDLKFKANLQNTPVYLLAQGAVSIAGALFLQANGRSPGPGGFFGGVGGSGVRPGFGPGAGPQADGNPSGRWVGQLSLVPTIGGSGGVGNANCDFSSSPRHGGGGGGALTMASSTSITVLSGGSIKADGGAFTCGSQFQSSQAGYGSGGAIRLVANSILASGVLSATTPSNQYPGVIRLEAPPGALSFTGSANPAAVLSTITAVQISRGRFGALPRLIAS